MTRNFIFKILKCLIILSLPLLLMQVTRGNVSESQDESEQQKSPQFLNIYTLNNKTSIPYGSSLELTCKAKGSPEPTIVWTRNNKKIERDMGKVIYKKWSIQLNNVITHDSGSYKCLVCNTHGCIEHTNNVTVYINYPLRSYINKKYLHNQTVVRSSKTTFECRVPQDIHLFIVWVKHSQKNESIDKLELKLANKLNTGEIGKIVFLKSGPESANILRFSDVSHEDEGWYSCVASNAAGRSIASAYLRVVDGFPKDVVEVQTGNTGWITISVVVLVVTILVGNVYIVYILRNLKYLKQEQQRSDAFYQWIKTVIITNPPSDNSFGDLQIPDVKIVKQRTALTGTPNKDPAIEFSEYDFPLDCNWEIPRPQIALGSTLGEGAFGRVVMAQVSLATTLVVAVKMIKDDYTDADVISLVREMELMKIIGSHKNIINLLGCCSQNGPLWVIVEFARHGNLKDFLKNNHPSCQAKGLHLTKKHLTTFAWQIAQGMEYLASKKCIHRDLAARNVLVSDDYIMKIADFGLARDIHESDYYRKYTNGRLPIKWMAPESLQSQFYNSKSDVWSYGVLLWEIMSYGDQPYPNIMSADELYSYLISGKRMQIPKHCSHKMYQLMLQCWHLDSNARPTFTEIVKILEEIIQLSSIKFNTRYVNLPEPVLNKEEEDDQRTQESVSVSYTPMFRMSQ